MIPHRELHEPPKASVLLVDDHAPNLIAAAAVLEPLGYPIVTADSGAEALRKLSEEDFVMVVMDVHMPELDGFQTVELFRRRNKGSDVPVVFVTATDATNDQIRRGYALGAIDFIRKPYDADVLCAKVGAIVGLYTRGQRIERARSRQFDEIKDLFLGAVGHDLRNPLNAVVMAHRLALGAECSEPSHRTLTERADRAAQRMSRIIDDILDLTRGQFTGGIPVVLQPTDLAEICRATIGELRVGHPSRVVNLDLQGDVVGMWDGARLGRIVSNLVGNAILHGGDEPIRVDVCGDEHRVTIAVKNGGAPIPPAILPRLFEPFRRGDSSAEGLGLGLYIVREIARAHQGTVNVSSTKPGGTVFTVILPRNPAARAPLPVPLPRAPGDEHRP